MRNESGNVLWFILLAIALLAALTLMITRSSNTVEQSGDVERARIQASQVMRFAAGVAQAVDKMRLNGVSENEISFENSAVAGYEHAPVAADDHKIFHVKGGGLTYQSPPDDIGGEWFFTGANSIEGAGEDGTGASSSEDNELLIMLSSLSQTLCARINTELGIAGIPQDAGKADISTKYTGTFANGEVIENMGGKKTGCFQGFQDENGDDVSGTYYFYHALIVR